MHSCSDTQSLSSLQRKSQGRTVPDIDVHVITLAFSRSSLQAAHSGHNSTQIDANAQPSNYCKTRRNVRHSTVYVTSALYSIARREEEENCVKRSCIVPSFKKSHWCNKVKKVESRHVQNGWGKHCIQNWVGKSKWKRSFWRHRCIRDDIKTDFKERR